MSRIGALWKTGLLRTDMVHGLGVRYANSPCCSFEKDEDCKILGLGFGLYTTCSAWLARRNDTASTIVLNLQAQSPELERKAREGVDKYAVKAVYASR